MRMQQLQLVELRERKKWEQSNDIIHKRNIRVLHALMYINIYIYICVCLWRGELRKFIILKERLSMFTYKNWIVCFSTLTFCTGCVLMEFQKRKRKLSGQIEEMSDTMTTCLYWANVMECAYESYLLPKLKPPVGLAAASRTRMRERMRGWEGRLVESEGEKKLNFRSEEREKIWREWAIENESLGF